MLWTEIANIPQSNAPSWAGPLKTGCVSTYASLRKVRRQGADSRWAFDLTPEKQQQRMRCKNHMD